MSIDIHVMVNQNIKRANVFILRYILLSFFLIHQVSVMPIRSYLISKCDNKKCRLNGIKPSSRLPWKEQLRHYFADHIQLYFDQLPRKVDLRPQMTDVEDQSRIGSW